MKKKWKAADETGWMAELLQCAPEDFFGGYGVELEDGLPVCWTCVLQYLISGKSALKVMALLDEVVANLNNIGLKLNAAKAIVLTSETQPPRMFPVATWIQCDKKV